MATNPWSFGLTPEEQAILWGQPQGLLGQAAPAPAPDTPVQPLPGVFQEQFTQPEPAPPIPEPPQQENTQQRPLVIDLADKLSDADERRDTGQPPLVIETSGLGAIAQAHTAQDEAAAEAEAKAPNIEVKGTEASAYGQALGDLINSPDHWNDSAKEFAAAAKDLAEQFGDPTLASQFVPQDAKGKKSWEVLSSYRKASGDLARPSAVKFAGKPTEKTPEDQQRETVGIIYDPTKGGHVFVENTSTARMKAGARESGFAALQAAEEILGVDASHADARRKYYNSINRLIGPGLSASEVSGFKDALTLAAQQTVEQSPYLAASIAGGSLGGVVGGSIGAYLGAFGTSYGMELGQVEEATKDIDPNAKASWKTVLAAGGAAALDSVVPGGIGKALTAKVGEEAADRIAWQMLFSPAKSKMGMALTALRSSGAAMLKSGGEEAVTEAAQQFVEQAGGSWEATGKVTIPDDMLDQMINAGVGGFILGAGGGAAGHAAEAEDHGARMLGEMSGAEFQTTADQVATNRLSPAQPMIIEAPKLVPPTTVPMSHDGQPQTPLVPSGKITSKFGPRHTFRTANGQMASSNHAGNDIVIPGGKKADVPAAVDGVVTFAGHRGGYGNYVVITASDGTSFAYGHLNNIGVKVGDRVAQGDALGKQGATGNATGVHVHFERRDANGRVVDSMTGRPVTTMTGTNSKGETVVADNTPHRVKQTPFLNEEEDPFPLKEIEVNYEDATGQRIANEEGPSILSTDAGPSPSSNGSRTDLQEGVVSPTQPSVLEPTHPGAVATEDTAAPRQAPIASHIIDVLGASPDQSVDEISTRLTTSLNSAKAGNEAAAALARIAAERNTPESHDYNQPLPGEEPVFTDNTGTEVAGFHNPETGAVRGMGEAPQENVPETPAEAPQSASPQFAVADADQTEQLPETAPAQPEAAQQEPQPEPVAEPAPTEQAAETQPLVIEPPVETTEPERPLPPEAPANDIEPTLTKIDDKLFDLETDGTKRQAIAYAKRLVKKGILDERDVSSLAEMAKDRDMGVEDLTSEIRSSVSMWEDNQRRVSSGRPQVAAQQTASTPETTGGARVVQTKYGPITEPAPDDFSFTARINRERIEEAESGGTQQGRPEADGERGAQGPALDRPPVGEDGKIVLDHFFPEQGLSSTDPAFFGKNVAVFSRQERAYLRDAPPRTYFGIATGQNGGYKNEFTGRTQYAASMAAERLYDVATDPDNLWVRGQPAQSEWNIKNAGYSGYWHKNSELGLVAIVFDPVQVEKVSGQAPAAKPATKPAPKPAPKQEAKPAAKPAPKPKPQQSEPTSREIGQQREQVRQEAKAYRQSVLDKVHAIYREMGLQGLVPVEIVDRLFSPHGEEYNGVFDTDMVIRLAALAQGEPISDPALRTVARHEVVHWAVENRLWTPEEWRLLKKWAQRQPEIMAWARENYPKPQWTEEDILEEAVAEGFARLNNGRLQADGNMPDTLIQRLLQKLRDLATNLKLAFQNAGVTADELRQAQQLLADFDSGRHVAKLKQAQRPTFGRNVRNDSLSYELLTKGITQDQHWFLNRMGGPKFQSGWHGSPKDNIDKFSLDYIGTGEGAQAFGWGLYFAQKKAVAEWYQRKLTMDTNDPVDQIIEVNGKPIRDFVGDRFGQGYGVAGYEVADRIFSFLTTNKPYNGWLDAIHARIDNDIDGWVKDNNNVAERQELLSEQAKIAQIFAQISNQKVDQKSYPKGGKLYKVEVPENEDLLDLDKPVSEQSSKVQKSLAKLKATLEKADVLDEYEEQMNSDFSEWTGMEIIRKIIPRMAYDDVFPASVSDELNTALENSHLPMAASIYLRDSGIPGSTYLDRDSRLGIPGEPATKNFVIFDDDLIQLKAKYRVVDGTPANSPLSDPSKPDPGMIQRMHDNVMGMLSSFGSLGTTDWDRADNILDAWRRKMINKYQQVIKTQKRAEQLLGVDTMAADANPMDLITADERGYKLNVLTDTMIKPMVTELHNRGLELSDLGLYLYARHAPARNARIAKINKEFRDPANPGSGMTNAEAAKIMGDFAAQGKLTDLATAAQYVDNMIEYAQQERLNAGLLTSADIAAGFQPGEYYVPLRGHDEAEPEFEMDMPFAGGRKGGGFSVTGKEGHRMFGRSSKVDLEEIVGYSITQAQDAIDRSYRNRVAQSMANMFRAVPDPEFVKIDRVKRVPVWNRKTGKVEYQMQTRIVDPAEQQRTIYFKENGTVHKLTFNEHNMSALRFVKAAKNLGIADVGRALRMMSLYTRLFTKANTQWNLDFVLANAVKDVQTAVVNASTLNVKGLRRAIVKNLASMGPLKGAWWGVHNPAGSGFGTGKMWRETYAEFEANGGKLDYGQTGPVDDAIRRAKREMKNLKRSPINPIKAVQQVGGLIDRAAGSFENMTRLAAYKALRDAGIPPKKAAVAVRELTTNFQQHGEWGPKINAAYGFANATMIGGARFTQTIIKKPQVAGAIIGLGMLADFLNALLEPDRWDRYDEETKDREFIIMLPEEVGFDVHLPAGYGINTLATVGRKMSELWRGVKNPDGSKESVLDAAGDVFHSAINAFSPVPGHSFLNILAPSAVDPFVDLFQNEDNWGHRIYPEGSDRPGQQKPNSQLVRDSTSEFWRGLAENLNRLGGGNEVIPGFPALDHSPESYKYVASQVGGGAARTVGRIVGLGEDAATGQPPALNDVPVIRRFAGRPYGAAGAGDEEVSVFYDHYNTGVEALGTAKRMIERYGKDSQEYKDWKADHAQIIAFHKNIEAAEKRVNAYSQAESAIRRARDAAHGMDKDHRHAIFKVTKIPVPQRKLTDEEAMRQLDAIKVKRARLAAAFNDDWRKQVMGEKE